MMDLDGIDAEEDEQDGEFHDFSRCGCNFCQDFRARLAHLMHADRRAIELSGYEQVRCQAAFGGPRNQDILNLERGLPAWMLTKP